MTRKEQIEIEADKISHGAHDMYECFVAGAEWADAHQDYAEVNKFFADAITKENLELRAKLEIAVEAFKLILDEVGTSTKTNKIAQEALEKLDGAV